MAYKIVNDDSLTSVANAIRVQGSISGTLEFPDGFVSAIQNLAPSPTLQTKTKTYTPTTSQQTESVVADSGYDGLDEVDVTVNAIPSQYKDTTDATATADKILQGYTAYAGGEKLVGTASGNNALVITLTDSAATTETYGYHWTPDCSHNDYYEAVILNRPIGLKVNCTLCGTASAYRLDNGDAIRLEYHITEVVEDANYNVIGLVDKYYRFTYSGVTLLDEDFTPLPWDATAVASDVASGKIFYTSEGREVGTATPPSGTISITQNGTVDVTQYASANVNVSGGGASNFVTGAFTPQAGNDGVQTISVPYAGTGYPILAAVEVEGGARNPNVTDWYNLIQRYAIGSWVAIRNNLSDFLSSQATVLDAHKNSTTSATSFTSAQSTVGSVFMNDDPTSSTSQVWKAITVSPTKIKIYVSSTGAGLVPNITYRYFIVYSS